MSHIRQIKLQGDMLSQVARLYCTCFCGPGSGENWTQESAEVYLLERLSEGAIFWASFAEDGSLQAASAAGPLETSYVADDAPADLTGCAYVSLTIVEPELQGQGLGGALMRQRNEDIQRAGYTAILTRCKADNEPMLILLRRSGWQIIRRYTSELGGVVRERLLWLKPLNSRL